VHAVAVHLRNARRLWHAVVTAVADPDPAALERAHRLAPRAALLDDARDLVGRHDVDAVVVATPPGTHAELALRTLEAGKHLYLEKPVGIAAAEAERLATVSPRSGAVVAVGFNRRFHPVVVEARRLLPSALGPVVRVRGTFEEPLADDALPGWKRVRATGGGAPLDLASHHVDLVRHLLARSLVTVSAELGSVRSELDDCVLRFDAEGGDVELRCSFVRGRRDTLVLEDEAGRTVELDRWASTLTVSGRQVRTRSLVAARARALARPHADHSYRPSLHAWVARIQGAPQGSPAGLADGLASLEAILAAERHDAVGAA
jgi:predicted dehydrogenase